MFIRVIIVIIINLFIEGSRLISAQALFTLIQGWPLN